MKKTTAFGMALILFIILVPDFIAEGRAGESRFSTDKVVVEEGVKRFGPAWLSRHGGIYMLYVEGTHYDMGYQHGVLLQDEIQHGEMVLLGEYFRSEIENSVIGGIKPLVDFAEFFMQKLFFDPISRNMPDEAKQAMKGLAEGSGLDYKMLSRVMAFSDSGQAIEGMVYRNRKVYPGLAHMAEFGCTSFMAAGPATKGGHVIHGRNFDYPGAGWFDPHHLVVFCKPSSGQRYVMITSAGLHTAGVTGLNESGIAAGFHTAVTSDVKRSGCPVFCLGDRIVREAETIDDAIEILKNNPPAASFTMIVSSAREQKGVAIEITPTDMSVVPLKDNILAVANSYRTPRLMKNEIVIDWSSAINSISRTRRMYQLLQENHGSIDPQKGVEFLGDHIDINTGRERATGNVIAQAENLSSVVIDSTAMKLWVADARAPVCNTRYVGFDFEDGFRGPGQVTDLPVIQGVWADDTRLKGLRLFIKAQERFSQENDIKGAIKYLEEALSIDPGEPVYAQLAGLLLLKTGSPKDAAVMFENALSMTQTFHKQSVGHLWLARSYDLMGKRDKALEEYQEALSIPHLNPAVREAAENGLKKPFKNKQAKKTSVVFNKGDTYGY
jgi:hypothetical protein